MPPAAPLTTGLRPATQAATEDVFCFFPSSALAHDTSSALAHDTSGALAHDCSQKKRCSFLKKRTKKTFIM